MNDVQHARLYRSPGDPHELLVVGKRAHRAKSHLQSMMKGNFPQYQISTQNSSSPAHLIEFKSTTSLFGVRKLVYHEDDQKYIPEASVTCELFVRARVTDTHDPYCANFAVVPAHFVLDRSLRQLIEDNGAQDYTRIAQQNLASQSQNQTRFVMNVFNSAHKLDLRCDRRTAFSYRHFRDVNPMIEADDFQNFTGDMVLLEIEPRQLQQPATGERNIPLDDIEESSREYKAPHRNAIALDRVFPLRHPKDLNDMVSRKTSIRVGPYSGYLVESPLELNNNEESGLCDIYFVLHNTEG